jgi:hypothetical protein
MQSRRLVSPIIVLFHPRRLYSPSQRGLRTVARSWLSTTPARSLRTAPYIVSRNRRAFSCAQNASSALGHDRRPDTGVQSRDAGSGLLLWLIVWSAPKALMSRRKPLLTPIQTPTPCPTLFYRPRSNTKTCRTENQAVCHLPTAPLKIASSVTVERQAETLHCLC